MKQIKENWVDFKYKDADGNNKSKLINVSEEQRTILILECNETNEHINHDAFNDLVIGERKSYCLSFDGIPDVCIICSDNRVLDLHHIVPTSKGGKGYVSNLINLCPTCHALVHRKKLRIKVVR